MSTERLTEILNCFSAISPEIGGLHTEMNTRFTQVETRLDKFDIRLEQFAAETRAGFETVRTDIRRMDRKFDVVTQDLMELRTAQRDLEVRIAALESKQA
ncbi:MAG TPA: hypothetical protein VF525_18585 [Pyrinomonadaceae bacterium]|jgi:uncharacterized coiled-coil DUF342 family protein